ncbi:MAG: hypothetical protein IT293_01770 [Deltaproteobacteria bacterium]|nr:hypothetical protein [Deltaproteobacteria bacterium]
MSATLAIVLLWIGFAASHLGLSSVRVRARLVSRIGTGPFLGLYSIVAFLFFVPLVWIYFTNKHAGPLLWSIPLGPVLRWLLYAAMLVAYILIVAGLFRPSPAAIVPGDPRPRGAQRLTRHPLLMGFGLFGLLHMVPNGNAADVAFFGGFPLFVLIGCRHQDERKLATGPVEFAAFYRETPFLPFTGSATWQGIRELGPAVVLGALGTTFLLRWFHGAWFGP